MGETIAALASMFFGAKLKGSVEQAGYEYVGAIGGSGLLKQIETHDPIAILLDLGKDDIDVEEVVRSVQSTTNTPIIAFCGHVETKKLEAAKLLGCHITTNGAISCSFDTVLNRVLGNS